MLHSFVLSLCSCETPLASILTQAIAAWTADLLQVMSTPTNWIIGISTWQLSTLTELVLCLSRSAIEVAMLGSVAILSELFFGFHYALFHRLVCPRMM